MVGSMAGGETVPAATRHQQVYYVMYVRIVAGAQPQVVGFDNAGAQVIADGERKQEEHTPHPAFAFVIERHKDEQEQVERCPGPLVAQEGH